MEKLLNFADTCFCKIDRLLFLIDYKISGLFCIFFHNSSHLGKFRLGTLFKLTRKNIAEFIKSCRLTTLSRYYKRSSGFIDKNRVDLIDDCIIKASLYKLFLIDNHVIPEIIKSKFVIGYICDIRIICLTSLIAIHTIKDNSDRKSEEFMYLAHPLGITLGKIIINRNNMYALAFQCIKICRKKTCLCLTFTGSHLCDSSLMENNTTHKLHSVMFCMKHSSRCLPYKCICFYKKVIKCLACCKPVFKFLCFISHLLIREL